MTPTLVVLPADRRLNLTVALAVALALGNCVCALAAEPTPGDSSGELEAIVVTANRREQNVLDVPYNISAVTGPALESAGATSLADLSRLLPGVTIPDLGPRANSNNSLIIIRGLNVNDPVESAFLPWGSVPTVSTYVDDVPLYVNLKLSDVQRIEVLRGPQGTLYGSGAVGGIVKVLHNQPDLNAFSAEVSTDVSKTSHAQDPSYDVQAILNIPINDMLAFRLSTGYEKTAGFINALNAVVFNANQQPALANPADPLTSGLVYQTLSHVDDARAFNVRAALLWKPAPWLDANLAFQQQDDQSNGFSQQTVGLKYETEKLVPEEPDHRIVDLDSLTLTADVGFATVTSSTSYSINNDKNTYDYSDFLLDYSSYGPEFYGNYPRITSLTLTDSRDTSFTQELRLVSKEGGAWDYTAGAFFQHQIEHLFQYQTAPGFAAWSQLPGSAGALPGTTPGGPYANFGDYIQYYNGGTRPSAMSPTDTNYTYKRDSGFLDRAFYGELTRHLTDKWQITGGARMFWQDFSQDLYTQLPYGGPSWSTLPPPENLTDHFGTTIVSKNLSFRNHLWKLNSSYEITESMRVYATFSEGFRHGGVNAIPLGTCLFCESAALVPYNSDTVKNYELGFKGTVARWLRYSAAVYQEKWSNIQIQGFSQANWPVVINGKDAKSQGVELEVDAKLGGGWSTIIGYGFTDAKITNDFVVTDPIPNNGGLYTVVAGHSGDRLPYVPRQTITADLGYEHALGSDVSFDAHVNAAYRSDVTTQLNPSVSGYRDLGGFTTINGAVGIWFAKNWHTRLFVTNLTNTLGVTSSGPLLRLYVDPRYTVESPTRPRTVGLGIDYKFH